MRTPGSLSESRIADAIVMLLAALAFKIQEETHVLGLKPQHWLVLRYLARAQESARTADAIPGILGLDARIARAALKALRASGCITLPAKRGRSASRAYAMTPIGEAMLERDPLIPAAPILARRSNTELAALVDALTLITEVWIAASGPAPSGGKGAH